MSAELVIPVDGGPIVARHHEAVDGDFTTPAGRPCVVMAHGFGATRDSGLEGYAERLAEGGLDVLAFDYRGFGESGGVPRRVVAPRAQQEDYRAAVAYARTLPGVDPERIVAWGVSLSGGHVFDVAAADPRLAAVVAVTPAVDGAAAMPGILSALGTAFPRVAALVAADLAAAVRGGAPVECAVTGRPGTPSILCAPGVEAAYTGIAGPTWVNAVAARSIPAVGRYRIGRRATAIRIPVLAQIADEDRVAPPAAARRAAFRARADVRHYPCDHFDVYPGSTWFERIVGHQLHFLHRHLVPGSEFAPLTPPRGAAR